MFAGHRDVGRCLGRFVVDGKNSAEGDIGNILSIVLTFPGTVVVDDLDHGIFVICGNVDDGVIRQLQSYFSGSWLNTGILPIFSVDPLLLHSFPE